MVSCEEAQGPEYRAATTLPERGRGRRAGRPAARRAGGAWRASCRCSATGGVQEGPQEDESSLA